MASLRRPFSASAILLLGGSISWYVFTLAGISGLFNDLYQALWHVERHGITSIARDGTLLTAAAVVEGAATAVFSWCLLRRPHRLAAASWAWFVSVLLVVAALMVSRVTPLGRIDVLSAAVAVLGVCLLINWSSRRSA